MSVIKGLFKKGLYKKKFKSIIQEGILVSSLSPFSFFLQSLIGRVEYFYIIFGILLLILVWLFCLLFFKGFLFFLKNCILNVLACFAV